MWGSSMLSCCLLLMLICVASLVLSLSPWPLPCVSWRPNQAAPVSEALVTVWFPPMYSPLRKRLTGCEPSCDPRSEVSPHQAELTSASVSLKWNSSCFVWWQKHVRAVCFILLVADFTSETSPSLSFLSCNTVMWCTLQLPYSAYFPEFSFNLIEMSNVLNVSSVREWQRISLSLSLCLSVSVWAALPSLANKMSGFCNKSLGLRCFLCEHSGGGQETLSIWPICDTCVFFKASSISSSPSD